MNAHRKLTIGKLQLSVPPRIQRLPSGWQVRYHGTKHFADGQQGPDYSLHAAITELERRYAEHPPEPVKRIRTAPLRHKQNDLPAGISGPVLTLRKGRAPYGGFKVSLPRKGGGPNTGTTVYIGVESNWSEARYQDALAKAIKLRRAAVRAAAAT